MHASVMGFVEHVVARYRLGGDVLEVGSRDENGTVRPLFDGSAYTGVDMRDGPGVDRVATADRLPWPNASFDVVVSTEMLEHDRAFWRSLAEMGRVLRPGGWLIVTARGNGFPEHAYPDDYWRFMPSSIPLLADLAGVTIVEAANDPDPAAPGVLLAGRKP